MFKKQVLSGAEAFKIKISKFNVLIYHWFISAIHSQSSRNLSHKSSKHSLYDSFFLYIINFWMERSTTRLSSQFQFYVQWPRSIAFTELRKKTEKDNFILILVFMFVFEFLIETIMNSNYKISHNWQNYKTKSLKRYSHNRNSMIKYEGDFRKIWSTGYWILSLEVMWMIGFELFRLWVYFVWQIQWSLWYFKFLENL
jgi:hypothetical protein